MAIRLGVGTWTMQVPYMSVRPASSIYRDGFVEMARAEELGLESVWLGEHHHWYDGYLPSPLTLASAILARTSRVKVALSVLLLPLHGVDGLIAACQAMNEIAPGRLRLALGLGYRTEEFEAVGLRRGDRRALFEAALERLLEEPFVNVPDGVEVWLGGGVEASVRRAARHGLPLVLPNTIGPTGIDAYRQLYEDESGGVVPRFGMVKDVWVGHDLDDLERARRGAERSWRSYSTWWVREELGDRVAMVDAMVRRTAIGTPNDVVSDLRRLTDAGITDLACRIVNYGNERHEDLLRCMELIGLEVAPMLESR